MAMKLHYTDDNWKLILMENEDGTVSLLDVSGNGEVFAIPSDVSSISKHAICRKNCPYLKMVTVPNSVQTVSEGAFVGFGRELNITCAHAKKPSGFFEGEYIVENEADGSSYFSTNYGSWLRPSVVLHSRDCEGRLTFKSASAEADINNRPTVCWGN